MPEGNSFDTHEWKNLFHHRMRLQCWLLLLCAVQQVQCFEWRSDKISSYTSQSSEAELAYTGFKIIIASLLAQKKHAHTLKAYWFLPAWWPFVIIICVRVIVRRSRWRMDSIWYTFFIFIFRIGKAVRVLTSELQHRDEDKSLTATTQRVQSVCHTGQHDSNMIQMSHWNLR